MIGSGIKASKLIKILQDLMNKHGDRPCYAGGGDYPEGVSSVAYRPSHKGDGYVPGDSFEVY